MEVVSRGNGDLYHRYRPCKFSEIYGHKSVVKSLSKVALSDNTGNSYLFIGSSGCGKTTAARILAMSLNCPNLSKNGDPCAECRSCLSIMAGVNPDVQEINAAEARGIDEIRRIKDSMALSSLTAKNKVYILDECHSLTKDAQQSLLKVLEESPKGVYIVLCSTEPKKLLPTVTNRCQKFKFDRLSAQEIKGLVTHVFLDSLPEEWFEKASAGHLDGVLDLVINKAQGSPRAALVYLQQVLQLENIEECTTEGVAKLLDDSTEAEALSIELCRALIQRKPWNELVALFKAINVPPEVVRLTVLGYFRSVLLKANKWHDAKRASEVMECFITPYYEVRPENNLVLSLFKAKEILSGPSAK
jgi:DNA polymerase III subunit gamma/tau